MDRSHALCVSGRRARSVLWQAQPREDGSAPQRRCHLRYLFHMPPEMWPSTLDDFWAYWNHKPKTLEVTDWARSCKDLLHPKHILIWLKPLSPTGMLPTILWRRKGRARSCWNFQFSIVQCATIFWVMSPSFCLEGKDKSEHVLLEGFEEGC